MEIAMRKKLKMDIGRHSETTGWEDLPEDILCMIFDRLLPLYLFKSVYSVCRRWRSVSRLRIFWYPNSRFLNLAILKKVGVDETAHFMKLVTSLIDEVDRKSESITGIAFPYYFHLSDNHLFDISQRFPKLQRLNIPTDLITRKGFSQAIEFLKNLRQISIGQLHLSDYIYFIEEIGVNCKNLEIFGLSCGSYKTVKTIIEAKDSNAFVLDECTSRKIANSLSNVEHLVFTGCVIYKAGLKNIMSNCHCLKDVNMLGCKHMMSRTSNEEYLNYKLRKRILKDNSIGWSATTVDKGMKIYSAFSMLYHLWGF
ncbi:hypothetical protein ACHQM5_012439 [Ranunculus cassubicifolius]